MNNSDDKYPILMNVAARPDVVFSRGEGNWLFDKSGNAYLDFVQGWAVNSLGHCPPALVRTLTRQAKNLWNASPAFYNKPMVELAASLTSACCMDQVFFASSGAEANEGAIKLARKWAQIHKPQAFEIVTATGSFHGRTLATMSASGKPSFEMLFNPKVEGFCKVPFNDIDAMKTVIGKNTIAVMLEPIQGEAGVIPATSHYLKEVAALCKQHNTLLILDEIQTGIGRTGKFLAAEGYGVSPDILTLGKGLGGGAPLSALLAKKHCCCFVPGDQGGTFSGNPLLTAVGMEVLNTVNTGGFLTEVKTMSCYFQGLLKSLFGIESVRGEGLLLAVNFPQGGANKFVERAFEKRVLINAPNDYCVRFMPALNVSKQAIDELYVTLQTLLELSNKSLFK